ncbi:MAG: hypothetical protein ACT4P7_15250 [Gemmatimonadaceae bacterium]
MPRNRDLKRLVRSRMRKTGEAYTAARAQLTRSPRRTPAAITASIDYAALAGMSDDKIKEKTNRTWEQWTRVLDGHDAEKMVHGDIARLVNTTYHVGDWWTQAVTVGYERIKGLRALGQRRDGTYEVGKSRTFSVPVATLFEACAGAGTRRRWLAASGVKVRTATSPKSIRLAWGDGTIVVMEFTPKGKDKSSIAVQHTKLPDKATAERLKVYWAEQLTALGKALVG